VTAATGCPSNVATIARIAPPPPATKHQSCALIMSWAPRRSANSHQAQPLSHYNLDTIDRWLRVSSHRANDRATARAGTNPRKPSTDDLDGEYGVAP
jgi:hypothetical protein